MGPDMEEFSIEIFREAIKLDNKNRRTNGIQKLCFSESFVRSSWPIINMEFNVGAKSADELVRMIKSNGIKACGVEVVMSDDLPG